MHKFSKTMKIIRSILLLAVGFGTLPAQAQLTIDACQQKAQANYPLVAQYGLIRQSEQYDLENANKGYLPQLSLSAKASYQTDVTKIPFSLPGIDIPTLSKDQYQVVAEVNQVIWDGGNIRAKKQNVKASAEVDLQQQQVDMYAIRERVNSLFFGILLTEEQLELNRLYDEELERNYRKISSFIENGVANQADLDAVQVEQLSNRQQRVSLEATNRAYRQMLGAFIGENADSAELICPEVGSEPAPTDVNRPELRLLDADLRVLNGLFGRGFGRIVRLAQRGHGRGDRRSVHVQQSLPLRDLVALADAERQHLTGEHREHLHLVVRCDLAVDRVFGAHRALCHLGYLNGGACCGLLLPVVARLAAAACAERHGCCEQRR